MNRFDLSSVMALVRFGFVCVASGEKFESLGYCETNNFHLNYVG